TAQWLSRSAPGPGHGPARSPGRSPAGRGPPRAGRNPECFGPGAGTAPPTPAPPAVRSEPDGTATGPTARDKAESRRPVARTRREPGGQPGPLPGRKNPGSTATRRPASFAAAALAGHARASPAAPGAAPAPGAPGPSPPGGPRGGRRSLLPAGNS